MNMTNHQETPDIEVQADQWEAEQEVLRELSEEDDGLESARGMSECMAGVAALEAEWEGMNPDGTAIEDREDPWEDALHGIPDPYAGINSCDALRIIDGIDPELDDLDAAEQRIIDNAKAMGVAV
jgi:hypothetical protein